MDTTYNILDNTPENITELEKLGYTKSPVSKPDGMNKALCYSVRRGVYWFTDKWVARRIYAEINRRQVGTLIII